MNVCILPLDRHQSFFGICYEIEPWFAKKNFVVVDAHPLTGFGAEADPWVSDEGVDLKLEIFVV